MMLSVGFLSALLTNGAPSVTNRFLQSHAWQYGLSTDFLRSSPICVVPTSWMISPPREMAQLSSGPKVLRTSPPAVSMISRKVSRACLAIRISSSVHLKWNLSTGMPHWSTVSSSISQ